MNKILKISVCLFSAIVLTTCSIINSAAEAVYVVNGYSYTFIDNESISLCGWDNRTPNLIIPDSISGKYVKQISFGAFRDNTEITSVDFSQAKHLQEIKSYAFSNCSEIIGKLDLSGSFSTVGDCAFENCSSIESVLIGENLKTIPNQCFNKCLSLDEVEIFDGVEKISAFSFSSCPNLKKVSIPDSVSFISDYAFNGSANTTIYCFLNSYAQQYAVKRSIPYVITGGVMIGDVNGDNTIDVRDVTMIQRIVAELEEPEGIFLSAADTNTNGSVDVSDVTALQMFIAEYETPYPIGELII